MFLFILLFPLVLLFARHSKAQDENICCGQIGPTNVVDKGTRDAWCDTQKDTCDAICSSHNKPERNDCNATTLEYTCQCSDNFLPDLDAYRNTIPSLQCRYFESHCSSCRVTEQLPISSCSPRPVCGRISAIRTSTAALSSSTTLPSKMQGWSTTSTQTESEQLPLTNGPFTPGATPTEGGVNQPFSKRRIIDLDLSSNEVVAIAVTLSIVLCALGLILWYCWVGCYDRRKLPLPLSFWRNKNPIEQLDAPLDHSGIELVNPYDPALLRKPELHPDAIKPELSCGSIELELPSDSTRTISDRYQQVHGLPNRRTSGHGSLYELDSQDHRVSGTLVATPREMYHGTGYRDNGGHPTGTINPADRSHPLPENSTPTKPPSQASVPALPVLDTDSTLSTSAHSQMAFVHPPPKQLGVTHSLSPPTETGRRHSSEDIEQLEEEERRLDAEIERVNRLRELRYQKLDVQKKLKDAKCGIRDV